MSPNRPITCHSISSRCIQINRGGKYWDTWDGWDESASLRQFTDRVYRGELVALAGT